jgi:hypothetical protein|nr:MAG TPA: Nucleotide modification associated domain 1 [Caudoviricetes sp.]
MTRKEKVDVLERYCDHCGDTCDKCELKNMYDKETDEFTNNYTCEFNEMDDKMLDKIYDWYKELDSVACENAEVEWCEKEPDDLKLHIEPKVIRHRAICQKLNQVYKAKNHDYGDSFSDTYKKLGIISAVTRLSDKMNRLMSLAVSHDAQVKDEKIEDTLLDMANYAIMTLIELGYEVDE